MTQASSSYDLAAMTTSAVELRVPTGLGQLAVVRAVTESLATREDFDLDAVADLKMAVDEACASLISRAALGASLDCVFEASAEALAVTVRTTTGAPGVPNQHSFGWHVLATLTDELSAEQVARDEDPSGYETTIRFVVHKGTART